MERDARETKYERILNEQRRHEWDAETDIPWTQLDVTRPLLPLDRLELGQALTCERERLVVSQFLGLVLIQAIAQHEAILGVIRDRCVASIVRRHELGPGATALLEQFFEEEAKHSGAFARYVSEFASVQGFPEATLTSLLPKYSRDSWFTKLFLLNSRLGGNAVWHLVHLTELESIDLFRYLRATDPDAQVEPVYFALNRLHYEEEVRHISVPPLVLNFSASRFWKNFNRRLAQTSHVLWSVVQLRRLGKLRHGASAHPFFTDLRSAYAKITWGQYLSVLRSLFTYIWSGRRVVVPGRTA